MAIINLSPSAIATTSTIAVDNIKLRKSLRSLTTATTTNLQCLPIGRVRTVRTLSPALLTTALTIRTVIYQLMRSLSVGTTSTAIVRFFVNAAPVPPPVGKLSLATLDQIINPNAAAVLLNRSRLPRNDTIPISFSIRGKRLQGLSAVFSARQVGGGPTALQIQKTATTGIYVTAPAVDPTTQVEYQSGNFAIEPNDTQNFPDSEIELVYHFYLSDNQGRTYTIERGSFTVFPV